VVESDSPPQTKMQRTLERAGSLIGKLKLSRELADPETRARAAWTLAAGKKIAEHTLASALVRGTLVVEVTDIVWQRQLHTLRRFLLKNLKEALGEELVTEIDFRPMPPRRKPQRAESARPASAESEGIADPVMAMLYRESKRRGTA
jgi:predicted nucleic acid-binding Zn ribbon protein